MLCCTLGGICLSSLGEQMKRWSSPAPCLRTPLWGSPGKGTSNRASPLFQRLDMSPRRLNCPGCWIGRRNRICRSLG
jgi:hypothetical protein